MSLLSSISTYTPKRYLKHNKKEAIKIAPSILIPQANSWVPGFSFILAHIQTCLLGPSKLPFRLPASCLRLWQEPPLALPALFLKKATLLRSANTGHSNPEQSTDLSHRKWERWPSQAFQTIPFLFSPSQPHLPLPVSACSTRSPACSPSSL